MSAVFWITGLSGSGKSTISKIVQAFLHEKQKCCIVLDGDCIRRGLSSDLKFDPESRCENSRRIAEISKILIEQGIIVIVAVISPYRENRSTARSIIGTKNFHEIFMNVPLHECMKRDVKGLYSKAKIGLIETFTGISDIYEPPIKADLEIQGDLYSARASADFLIRYMINII